MILHIVLFRPKPGISEADREAMLEALSAAAAGIATIRRFRFGKRVTHGRPYEQLATEHYPYAAMIEFDDLPGLQAYLDHPEHRRLGELFYELLESGLVCDYDVTEVPFDSRSSDRAFR
jgi:hypothetical protein